MGKQVKDIRFLYVFIIDSYLSQIIYCIDVIMTFDFLHSSTLSPHLTYLSSSDPKLMEDVKVKTFSGAIVSVIAAIFIVVLILTEFQLYLTTETQHRLHLDTTRGERLKITIDVSFPRIPCSLLTMKAQDVAGESHLDLVYDIRKKVLTKEGHVLPQEYTYGMLVC